jgi:hypothetical protein
MSQQQQQTASKKKKIRVYNEREQVIAQGVWLEAIFSSRWPFLLFISRTKYIKKAFVFAFDTTAKTICALKIH